MARESNRTSVAAGTNGGVVDGRGPRREDILPLAFCFQGDFLVHLLTVDPDATVEEICSAAAGFIAGRRVSERSGQLKLIFEGREQPRKRRARDLGIGWLDYVEIAVADEL